MSGAAGMAALPSAPQAAFDRFRAALERAGYTEGGVCSLYSIPSLRHLRLDEERIDNPTPPDDALRCLVRLFLECRYAPEQRLVEHFGAETVAAMRELGVIEGTGDRVAGTVQLSPLAGLVVATDRWTDPDGRRLPAPEDIVYPAHAPNTLILMASTSFRPSEAMLDLCAGTGIAGLFAARTAQRVVACDVNPRASAYVEFNARLNGIPNVVTRTGDLWEPVAGETFDLVVAHPPYVPMFRQKWIFHSGGVDGEQISRQVIAGLPKHLRPGGRYTGLLMGSDRKDGTLEHRIRGWLGEAESEFDVALVQVRVFELDAFVESTVLKNGATLQDAKLWRQKLDGLGVQRFLFCYLVIERTTEARAVATARRTDGPQSGRPEYEWMLRLEQAAADPRFAERILDTPLHPPFRSNLRIAHDLEGTTWAISGYTLHTDYPFRSEKPVPGWAAILASKCDGTRTGRDFYEAYREAKLIPAEMSPYAFGLALQALVLAGSIELEGFRTPRAEG
ncbi:MAG: methyltransferase [Bryobacteraceae bacterium]|nr:methyltransferase [Bryobacteraceae bacterium]